MSLIVESWFIPFDILQIICTTFVIVLSSFFVLIIVRDKTCHTIPMILVANSYLVGILAGSVTLAMAVFTLQNDLKQIQYQDSYCILRGYLVYVSCALQNYSYLLVAIYRYVTVVYRTRLFWQSIRAQIFLLSLKWIFSFGFSLAFMFTGDITYNVDNQMCQAPLRLSFAVIYGAFGCYIIPVSLIMFVYMKLVRYVHTMKQHVTLGNTFNRAQKDLKMVRRIVILVTMLLIICLPYASFILVSFFTTPPKYHFRIAFIFVDISFVAVTITLFQFTDSLKASVKKLFNNQRNTVVPTLT